MATGARFAKWGLGFFLFGVFASFGIVAHYCVGARWPTGQLFAQNITLWWACPWTLAVASVQIGGLGMAPIGFTRIGGLGMSAIGLTRIVLSNVSSGTGNASDTLAFWLCSTGLIGVFLVGYPGYFAFDAIWPSFFYSPIETGKNAWLLSQALFIAFCFLGVALSFGELRTALGAVGASSGARATGRGA